MQGSMPDSGEPTTWKKLNLRNAILNDRDSLAFTKEFENGKKEDQEEGRQGS